MAQRSPEIQGGMSGSMHNPRDGYGFGALQMTHLISDKNSSKKHTPSWQTNNDNAFVAVNENALPRDHRQYRLKSSIQPPRKLEMSMTAAGSIGSFDSGRKEFFRESLEKNRLSKKVGKSLSAAEKGGRGENFFLSSGDYGALRRAERCSQPHQEPIANTLCKLLNVCISGIRHTHIVHCRYRPTTPVQRIQEAHQERTRCEQVNTHW
jgi:hypothetical protein